MKNWHDFFVTIAYLAVATLLLYSCAFWGTISDTTRKVAEPIDRHGCLIDCQECEFSRYIYETHDCFCVCDGVEVQLY